MVESVRYVLAIKPGDDYLHVGAAELLLHHLGVTPEKPVPAGLAELELYGADGTRLEIGDAGGESALVPRLPGEMADPQLLVDRIAVVLARAQVALDRDPDSDLGDRVPQLQAKLPAVLAALAEEFGFMSPPVPAGLTEGDVEIAFNFTQSVFHNFLHTVGLA